MYKKFISNYFNICLLVSHVFCMQEIKIENRPTWCPIENLKYRLIHGKCFYFETVKQHSYEIAQRNCDGKFPNGGKLFEPQTLEFNKKVLEASREIIGMIVHEESIKPTVAEKMVNTPST